MLPFGEERLRSVDLPPFAAAIQAGAKLVMTAHLALPALNGGFPVPSTLSTPVLRGLLRRDLGFEGVIVTDALNMEAITQGQGLIIDAIAACNAGADLLMLMDLRLNFKACMQAYCRQRNTACSAMRKCRHQPSASWHLKSGLPTNKLSNPTWKLWPARSILPLQEKSLPQPPLLCVTLTAFSLAI